MRLSPPITIATLLLLAQISAGAAEIAVLRNGFSIRFERKEQTGKVTRLYTGSGYVDLATDQIASFEAEEPPVVPPPEAAAAPAAIAPPVAQPSPETQAAVPAGPAQQPAAAADLDEVVKEISSKNHIDPDFVRSVIKAESNFKVRAVSKKGAQGLMQLMPATAAQLGVTDPFDAKANVAAGTAHLNDLLKQYHDDPIKALAAYNAGAHRVKQYNGVPPYRETRAYIAQIVRDFNAKKRAQMKSVAAPAGASAKDPAAVPAKAGNLHPAKKAKPQEAGISRAAGPA